MESLHRIPFNHDKENPVLCSDNRFNISNLKNYSDNYFARTCISAGLELTRGFKEAHVLPSTGFALIRTNRTQCNTVMTLAIPKTLQAMTSLILLASFHCKAGFKNNKTGTLLQISDLLRRPRLHLGELGLKYQMPALRNSP